MAADKLRLAYVAPSVSLSLPWVAKELGIFAKYDLLAEILLITGSPRLVQSLIAGDVDIAFAGVTAMTRARVRGADVAILGAKADRLFFVVEAGKTSVRDITAAKQALAHSKAPIAGVVLNKASGEEIRYHYYYHYYHRGEPRPTRYRRWMDRVKRAVSKKV